MLEQFEISLKDIQIANGVCMGLAISFTALRLFERARLKMLGADDAWAAVSMTIGIIFMVALMLHVDEVPRPKAALIFIYYCLSQGFTGIIWSSRLSILMSLFRISSPGRLHTILSVITYIFLIFWVFLFAQVFWVCEREPGWKDEVAPQCFLGESVAIAQIVTDVLADAVLIATPVRIFSQSTLSENIRYRLMAVFGATMVTTLVSLVHAYYILRVGGADEALMAVIEDGVSLIICNLAVLVAAVQRFLNRHKQGGPTSQQDSYPLSSLSLRTKRRPTDTVLTYNDMQGNATESSSPKVTVPFAAHDDAFAISSKTMPWPGTGLELAGIRVTREVEHFEAV